MTKDELNEFDKVYAKRVSQILKSIPAGLKPSKATNDDNEGPEWVVCGTGVTGDWLLKRYFCLNKRENEFCCSYIGIPTKTALTSSQQKQTKENPKEKEKTSPALYKVNSRATIDPNSIVTYRTDQLDNSMFYQIFFSYGNDFFIIPTNI